MAEHGHTEDQPDFEAGANEYADLRPGEPETYEQDGKLAAAEAYAAAPIVEDLAASEDYAKGYQEAQAQLEKSFKAKWGRPHHILKRALRSKQYQRALENKNYSLGIMRKNQPRAEADAAFLREHIEVAAAAARRVVELQRRVQPGPGESLEEARERIEREYQSGRAAASQEVDLLEQSTARAAQAAQTAYDRAFLERTA